NLFEENEIPLTIGIVGSFFGEDYSTVTLIEEKLNSEKFFLEIANHSWNDDRLTQMTKSEQVSAILQTNEKIFQVLNKRPTTFIPPGNLFNEETVAILKENGFTHLSATLLTDPPPYYLSEKQFYHFPQTAETGECEDDCAQFFGVDHQKTFDDFKTSIQNNGYAVIMMHPQEFSIWENGAHQNVVDEKQIQELEQLITKLNDNEIDIVPLGKLNLDAQDREQFVYRYMPTCNCLAFRVDTVQDWWLADISMELIGKFNQNQFPLTIGVIGNFIGTDPTLVDFLKDTLKQNRGVEIANNGWNYEDFSKFNKNEQKALLLQSNDSIQNSLDVRPTVFIPPHNRHDDSTLDALKELGFTHISSISSQSEPPYPLEKESFYRFPSTAYTGTFNSGDFRFEGLPYQTTLDAIKNSIEENGFAVVTLNPQEYAMYEGDQIVDQIDTTRLNELEKLLKIISKSNFEIVSISQINLDSKASFEIPDWIKNNAGWWADNQITDSDFTSGIEFMIKENIIRIPDLPEKESTAKQQVPDWIKNNAGWWAQNLITDEDFVNGIEFLVKNGIILV
ncbi:MAG: polysaccharide deacetylase family protein, partial [Nitrosopumilaceae archaeon]